MKKSLNYYISAEKESDVNKVIKLIILEVKRALEVDKNWKYIQDNEINIRFDIN